MNLGRDVNRTNFYNSIGDVMKLSIARWLPIAACALLAHTPLATHAQISLSSGFGSSTGGGGGGSIGLTSPFGSTAGGQGANLETSLMDQMGLGGGLPGFNTNNQGASGFFGSGAQGAGGAAGFFGGGATGATGRAAARGIGQALSNIFGGGRGAGGGAQQQSQMTFKPKRVVAFAVPAPPSNQSISRLNQQFQTIAAQSEGSLSGARNVNVTREQGRLVLRGAAPTEYERDLAEQLALLEPGVSEVQNQITVPDGE